MKLQSYIILLLWVLTLPVIYVRGQSHDLPARKFTTKDGLEYGIVKVVQDKEGFIWTVCNYELLQRFDGKNTDVYFKNEDLQSLFIDSGENIWVTTGKGIFRFNRESNRFFSVAGDVTTPKAKMIFEPVKGKLFCLTGSGIYSYDRASDKFVHSRAPSHKLMPGSWVSPRKFTYANHVIYYHGRQDTIWCHNIQTGKAKSASFYRINRVMALSESEIIVSTWESKTWYYNFANQEQRRLAVTSSDFLSVIDVMNVDEDRYYLASSRGVLEYNLKTDILRRVNLSFDGKSIQEQTYTALCRGRDNLIWTGTANSLLCFDPSERQISYIQNDAADPAKRFNHNVRNFVEDENGNLWLATVEGVAYWDMKNNSFTTIRAEENATDRLNHSSIRGLVYDGKYLIIGQTSKGIWLYNPKTKKFKRPTFTPDENGRLLKEKIDKAFIFQIKTLKNGNHIVAGRNGAYLIDGETYTVNAINFPDTFPEIRFSYEDSKNNIFIGTTKGFYCFDASMNYKYKIYDELENKLAFCMLEQDDGYYLGTSRGLYFLSTAKGDSVLVKKVIPAFRQHSIRMLFKDASNTMWIVTESKLHRYFPETGRISTYGYSENIRGDFYFPNGYLRKKDGRVFLGSTGGINYFYPEKIDIYSGQLHPYLRDVNIREFKDSITNFGKFRRLDRHQNTININFSTPYYGNPRDVTYKYQLTENGEWFNHGNRSNITLWKLPPGNYQFRVAATLYNGVWHTSQDSFRFTIPPPFWETWWFTLCMIVLGCAVLYRIFMLFQRKLKTERLLNTFATSLYGHNTVNDILWETARNCVKKLKLTDCVIYEIDWKKRLLVQKAAASSKNLYNREIINVIEIPVGKGITGAVAESGKPERIRNTEKDPRYIMDNEKAGSEIAVPIRIDGEVFGIIDSEHPKANFYTRFHIRLLEKIAAICSDRIRKYLTEEKLRGKIARDLHDEMGSTLTSIHIISKITQQDLQKNIPARNQLTKINNHVSGMMEKMSDMVWVVNPANDGLDKLMYRIREYAVEVLEPQHIGLSFQEVKDAKYFRLNPEQRKNIYLIAKEALNNAAKYSKASKVGIRFKAENGILKMHILDNGEGYDKSVQHSGNGITNMRIRSEEISATLKVETAPGKGVSLLLCLAVEKIQPA